MLATMEKIKGNQLTLATRRLSAADTLRQKRPPKFSRASIPQLAVRLRSDSGRSLPHTLEQMEWTRKFLAVCLPLL